MFLRKRAEVQPRGRCSFMACRDRIVVSTLCVVARSSLGSNPSHGRSCIAHKLPHCFTTLPWRQPRKCLCEIEDKMFCIVPALASNGSLLHSYFMDSWVSYRILWWISFSSRFISSHHKSLGEIGDNLMLHIASQSYTVYESGSFKEKSGENYILFHK